tara:strand:+ start:1838 stop:7447 length:5610 start_codon:yes stop_codon:yes gene_type:complete
MPEIVRVFQSGRMNKDLDERLVPNGEYRDALNLQVATSATSQVGTFQNVKGNLEQNKEYYDQSTGVFSEWGTSIADGYIPILSNPVCVGSISDSTNETIYWFIASDNVSVIASYNTITKLTSPLLVDTQNILKFNKDFLITGINILEGMLLWTDNQTEPKNIKISDWVGSTLNFTTHSKIYNRDFTESDTTVIRKKPITTLSVLADDSGRGGIGTGLNPLSTIVAGQYENFTYIPDPLLPLEHKSLPTYVEDPALGSITISTTPAPDNYRVGDQISLTTSTTDLTGDTTEYSVVLLVTGPLDSSGNLLAGNQLACQIQSISSIIPRVDLLNWEVLLIEDNVLFEYDFPRFSYRWKYSNNQISGLAPFTEPVFVGSKFEYLSSDGYNVGMVNNARKIVLSDIDWGDEWVQEIEILYKASNSTAIYVVDKITDRTQTTFEIINEVIGAIIESNQLLRPYDNVPLFAKGQEITANRLIYANYTQQYDLVEPKTISTVQTNDHPGANDQQQETDTDTEFARTPLPSLKSMRTYQVGVNYMDKYGRETPVFTSNNGSFYLPVSSAEKTTRILTSIAGSALPDFATHFKYFVKETSNEYYNLALDRFYFAEDGNIWLSFPSSERNKISEESYLILKKQHDNDIAVTTETKFKVISIENEAPDFVATTTLSIADSNVTATTGNNPGADSLGFDFTGPVASENINFSQGLVATNFIVISQGSNITNEYEIASGGPVGTGELYRVALKNPLGQEAAFLDSLVSGDEYEIIIKEKTVEKKPEYEGRFFAKINRTANFDTHVIGSFTGFEPSYGVLESNDVAEAVPNAGPGTSTAGTAGLGWTDPYAKSCAGSWSNRIRKPVANQTWFGVVWSSFGNGSNPNRQKGTPTTPLLDDYLSSTNTKIRFIDANGNKSGIYTIVQAELFWGRRGFNGCGSFLKTTGSNSRKAVRVELDKPFEASFTATGIEVLREIQADSNSILSSSNPAIFETEPKEAIDIDIYYQASGAFPISEYADQKALSWFNCYSYGNGVESNRIRDDFNAITIDKGPVVSAPLDVPYQQEIKSTGLIFSQIFNSTSGVNNLNQFIQAEAITKDLLPEYGSIQKLRSRDTNLIALCEDKCITILADKDALYNADGSSNVTSNRNVLGQATSFAGEFGISTNPESFSEYGFRMYFTDKARGAVLRLSRDGLTEISNNGMNSFFGDNLILNNNLFGGWDTESQEYNLTFSTLSPYWQQTLGAGKVDRLNKDESCGAFLNEYPTESTTVSFKEEVSGWTSRKTFIPENSISLNNSYYTFKHGRIWHHYQNALHNTFYDFGPSDKTLGAYYESSFNVVFNESPTTVKGFKTVNYSGSDSLQYDYQLETYGNKNFSIGQIQAQSLIPDSFTTKKGWYTNSIVTDLQEGEIKEFIDKEGKKFNYIKGLNTFFNTNCDNNVDTREFSVQGIGRFTSIDGDIEPTAHSVTVAADPDCFVEVLAPVLVPQSFLGIEDTPLSIVISETNDCTSGITFELINDAVTGGSLGAFLPNGTVTFTPDLNYNGAAGTFTVRACCGSVCSSIVTMSISITPVAESPYFTTSYPALNLLVGDTWTYNPIGLADPDHTTPELFIQTPVVDLPTWISEPAPLNDGTGNWYIPNSVVPAEGTGPIAFNLVVEDPDGNTGTQAITGSTAVEALLDLEFLITTRFAQPERTYTDPTTGLATIMKATNHANHSCARGTYKIVGNNQLIARAYVGNNVSLGYFDTFTLDAEGHANSVTGDVEASPTPPSAVAQGTTGTLLSSVSPYQKYITSSDSFFPSRDRYNLLSVNAETAASIVANSAGPDPEIVTFGLVADTYNSGGVLNTHGNGVSLQIFKAGVEIYSAVQPNDSALTINVITGEVIS